MTCTVGYPHLPYVDAVHAELVAARCTPSAVHTGTTGTTDGADEPELVARFEWPEVTVRWTHRTGWRHEAPRSGGALDLDVMAAPVSVVNAVALLIDGHGPMGSAVRWHRAPGFERDLAAWEAR